jgi:hypothetical protein
MTPPPTNAAPDLPPPGSTNQPEFYRRYASGPGNGRMPLSPAELHHYNLPLTGRLSRGRGYEKDQVDALLDRVCTEIEARDLSLATLETETVRLRNFYRSGGGRPVSAPAGGEQAPEPSVRAPEQAITVLAAAQQQADATVDAAQRHAAAIVADAQRYADDLVASAAAQADQQRAAHVGAVVGNPVATAIGNLHALAATLEGVRGLLGSGAGQIGAMLASLDAEAAKLSELVPTHRANGHHRADAGSVRR